MAQTQKRLKVYYLSISTFSDNHLNTLHHLQERFDVVYGVIIPSKRANFTEAELKGYCDRYNIKLDAFHLAHRFRDPRNIASYFKVIRSIRKENPDIIYFTNFDQVYINLLFTLLGRKRVIIGFHDVVNHSNTRFDFLTNIGKNVLFRFFKYFRTYSVAQEKILLDKHPGKIVFTIPLPLMTFGELPARSNDVKKTSFLFFGNILSYKGLDILLRAAENLSAKRNDFTITVAGRTDEWEEIYAPLLTNKLILDKQVRFIENSEVPGLFSNADFLVLPYRDTTQSGPLMIAYNYNVPVIASTAEGFSEFVEPGVTGLSFQVNSVDELERTLEKAIELSGEEYDLLRKSQQEYINKHYSATAIVDKYEHMFQHVLGIKKNL
ncbi:MAG: glycosyltransferase [Chitinophagaceae bacterium]|nr:MAG: glycosyltransferase [Chitinophagaceae bacterium]